MGYEDKRRPRKRKTIGKMTQSRGAMPPPQRADAVKTKKNDRHSVKRKLKRGDYDD